MTITKENGKLRFIRDHIIKDSYTLHLQSLLLAYDHRTTEYGFDEKGSNGFFPVFQRDLVWTLEQKRSLILSIMDGMPIGTFYVNKNLFTGHEDWERKRQLLDNVMYDGQQRFTTIKDFLDGKFSIFVNGEEVYIKDFDLSLASHILNYLVNVVETHFDNYEDLVEYYIKINRGGTLHTDEDIQKAISTLDDKVSP